MVKRHYILGSLRMPSRQQNVVLNMQWLEMFQPFPAVNNLYLFKPFAPRIALALQELIGGSVAEVLPTCRMYFWRGSSHLDLSRKPSGVFFFC